MCEIFVRDDGSKDSTVSILEKYRENNKITCTFGKNVGACQSFLNAIFEAPKAEYYAFCDQDDVWDADKLKIAIDQIKDVDGPALYHGKAGPVDVNLNPLSSRVFIHKNTLESALLTSATGCTMVFNDALMQLLRVYMPNDKRINMHDAWVFRVAYAMHSHVVYDQTSHMKYRQHGNNVSGGTVMNFRQKYARAMRIEAHLRRFTAQELLKGYSHLMTEQNIKSTQKLATYSKSLVSKIKIICDKRFSTNYLKTNFNMRILFLLGKV